MTTKKTTLALVSVGALVLAAGSAWAQPNWNSNNNDQIRDGTRGRRGFGMRGRRGGFRMRGALMHKPELLKSQLGLSDSQVAQLKSIGQNLRSSCKPQRDQIRPLQQKLRALLESDSVDTAQIYALHSQIRSLRQLNADQRIKARLKVMQVLTKDQRTKLMQNRGRRGGKRGFGGGFGRGGGFGGRGGGGGFGGGGGGFGGGFGGPQPAE